MTTNVLVPIDGSEHSYGGLEYSLASFPDASITTLHVIDSEKERDEVGAEQSWEERARERAERMHARAQEQADRHDIDLRTETELAVPHRAILDWVVDDEIDHVVMGSHGESPITRPFVGRVTEVVVRRAPKPVTVVHETADEIRDRELPGRILVPIDGSEQATAALEYALYQFPAAAVTALHVVSTPFDYSEERISGTYLEPLVDDLRAEADELLAAAESRARSLDAEIDTAVAYDKPARGIVEYADEHGFDGIVMGKHGRSIVSRILSGSVAEAVAQRAPISVTLVHGRPHER